MLVMSRRVNESIYIGSDLLVTVQAIRSTNALIQFSCKSAGGCLGDFADAGSTWLERDQSIQLAPDISFTVVDIREDKVRVGIQAPPNFTVHRKEVADVIEKLKKRGDNDDDAMGSPVPR